MVRGAQGRNQGTRRAKRVRGRVRDGGVPEDSGLGGAGGRARSSGGAFVELPGGGCRSTGRGQGQNQFTGGAERVVPPRGRAGSQPDTAGSGQGGGIRRDFGGIRGITVGGDGIGTGDIGRQRDGRRTCARNRGEPPDAEECKQENIPQLFHAPKIAGVGEEFQLEKAVNILVMAGRCGVARRVDWGCARPKRLARRIAPGNRVPTQCCRAGYCRWRAFDSV